MRNPPEASRADGGADPGATSSPDSSDSSPGSSPQATDRAPDGARPDESGRAAPSPGDAAGPGVAPGGPPVLDAAALVAAPPVPLPEGSGMVAVIDPVTGEMRSPTAEEIRANFPELREPPGAPPTFPLPGGGVGADLSAGHGRNVSVATWSPSEGVRHHCMQADCPHPSHVSGASAAPPATSTSATDPNSSDPSPESSR